jgi:rhamnosyltransferase
MTLAGDPPHASVVVLTKNGCPDVADSLAAIFCQKTDWPYEVLVIDSGSSDATLDIVRQYPARLVEIPPETFNHGLTRNLGASMARGNFVAFITQDAIPADDQWLAALVGAFDTDENVAGVFSRQLAKKDAHVLTRRGLSLWVGGQDRRMAKSLPGHDAYVAMPPYERYLLATFDDVSSCLRKSVWQAIPFGDVHFGEDVDWAQRALQAGYTLVYEPESRVYHSHNRPALYDLKRIYMDHANLYRLFGLETVPTLRIALLCLFRAWGGYSLYVLHSDASLREKVHLLCLHIPFLVPAEVFGQYLGRHSEEFLARWPWFRCVDRWLRRGV